MQGLLSAAADVLVREMVGRYHLCLECIAPWAVAVTLRQQGVRMVVSFEGSSAEALEEEMQSLPVVRFEDIDIEVVPFEALEEVSPAVSFEALAVDGALRRRNEYSMRHKMAQQSKRQEPVVKVVRRSH
jgi:hypothetical protein